MRPEADALLRGRGRSGLEEEYTQQQDAKGLQQRDRMSDALAGEDDGDNPIPQQHEREGEEDGDD